MVTHPRMRSGWRRAAALAFAAALWPLAAGCFNPFAPRIAPDRGTTKQAPAPSTPVGVVELFEWCWDNRRYSEYEEIFTADFRFEYVNRDSAGNQRSEFLDRDAELEVAYNLFVQGSASEPPAKRIELTYTSPLLPFPDPRPGKEATWHQQISAPLVLEITTDEQEFRISGRTVFYLVRGDSALIPEELRERFPPSTERWWIERQEDETDEQGPAAAVVPHPSGVGSLRVQVSSVEVRPRGPAVEPARARGSGASAATPHRLTWPRLKRAYLGR
jgi:hypothetical protein